MKEYKYNRKFLKILLFTGIISITFFIITLFTKISTPGMLIFPIIMYFVFKNFTVIKTAENYCEIKIAPLRSLRIFKYSEMIDMEIDTKKIIIYIKQDKPIIIPLNILNNFEHEEVINFLQNKIYP